MGEGPGATHPIAKRRGRNAVKDREAREICLARKTAGRGNLSGRTVVAKKPEAARNEVQRRRALARIHDKYKAAVGVMLYRKDLGPSTDSAATAIPGTAPEAIPVHVSRATKKRGTIPPHTCCQWIGICGVEEPAHRNALSEPPSSGGLFARFIQDGLHDIRAQQLRRVRAPPPAGRPPLGSRALECEYLCRDARLHLRPLDSHQRDSGFADDLVSIVGLNAECRAPVPQPFKPSAQPQR